MQLDIFVIKFIMIAIISDIHSNYSALNAVLKKIDKMGIKKIICLGDTAGYYCEINECCQALRERKIFSIQGNHDWYISTGSKCSRSNIVNHCISYQRSIISETNLEWLKSLKSKARIENLNIVHGGWNDPLEEYFKPSKKYFSNIPGKFFASGHTHIPFLFQSSDKIYCNPGSVGQPRDGDPRASFAVWINGKFSIHRVQYDFKPLQKKMHDLGFDEYVYKNLKYGKKISKN
jgi:putative phosphoesterase